MQNFKYFYLNYLGYRHSAYVFGFESNVINSGIDGNLVPRGALLNVCQKGMLFSEAEVFSLLPEGETGINFEKAIGSMSLIDCSKFFIIK